MEKNSRGKSHCFGIDGIFLVHLGNMVRAGFLSEHGMALAGKNETGPLQYAELLHKILD